MTALDDIQLLVMARAAAATGKGRRIRVRSGLSIGEVARASGVTHAAVSRWEAGLRRPTGDAGVRWARVLQALEDRL